MKVNYKPVLTRFFSDPNSHRLNFYLQNGGYKQAKRVLTEMKPEEVIDFIKKSNLRGRGGAGFSTGMKWSFIPKNLGKDIYLVCNADESEPGTFKDRILIENDPHALIEGIIIASYAIGAKKSFIYIRGEFVEQYKILNNAIQESYVSGYLGKNVCGTNYSLDIILHRGAGAYICGEETALLSSLEGKRGYPRIKPPFPAIKGLYESPTIVNNVETLVTVKHIFENGIEWFTSIGTPKSPGPKLYCLSGHVKKPGLYELPLGMQLKDLVFDYGGGVKNDLRVKGVIPGGSSSGVLKDDELDIIMDFESLMAKGMILGTASVIVLNENVCMVDALWNIARFYHHESCGQCTPCREGSGWIEKLLERIERGHGTKDDLKIMSEIAKNMVGRTICVLADALAIPVEHFVKRYFNEFEAHILHKGCPNRQLAASNT
ncbi:MAG: NADH-quinone oxidoreductase subunit NuoF [Planctomycetes bacterium]|nr:NADH-quinone oxidoreductase subunit NuoF [Planctomycetota bacterium]